MFSDFFNDWSIFNVNEILLSVLIKSSFLEFIEIFLVIFKSSKFWNHLINKSSDSSFSVRSAVLVVILFKLLEFLGDSLELNWEFINFFCSKVDGVWNFAFIHVCSDIIDCFSAFISFCKNYYKIFFVIFVFLLDGWELIGCSLLFEIVFEIVITLLFSIKILLNFLDLCLDIL